MLDVSSEGDRRIDMGRAARRPIELAVIVPTYNERENVGRLYGLLEDALQGVRWEMIVVDDDSPDGTAEFVREMSIDNQNVRAIQRVGRRGLSTAVIEGMLATGATKLAVIDADLQHDERKLPEMLDLLRSGQYDIVVGSRYTDGGGLGEWDSKRARMSQFATRLAGLVLKSDLKDPMSGFFMINRDAFERTMRGLSGEGYKILLDLFASADPPLRFAEVPYEFRTRQHGESKLDSAVLWEYLVLIVDKLVGRFIPARLLLFALVGGSGVVVHFATFAALYFGLKSTFVAAQTVATVVAMTTNYVFNNILTYRDKRKKGWSFLTGLIAFYAICGIGVIGNVGVANIMYTEKFTWWLSSAAGIVIGTLWNYSASSLFVWKKK
ncbi:glycosyltransferase [Sphingomonas fennica]|uniref:Dolichol monophosphate mannose synthase n=1 Tax=Edaphosphingomonas fennica TaxID=114404 RepID=A0A2T4HT74_9SPHN|nr:glycosyltransferase family 2 protein [Sphingomonas fennica]PTD19001.1 dolichol monophosphate mannose synthase [Sphingomonas fennica]